jgi:hypothetical protein
MIYILPSDEADESLEGALAGAEDGPDAGAGLLLPDDGLGELPDPPDDEALPEPEEGAGADAE